MTASTLFATFVLLVLAVDEAAATCALTNVGAQTEVVAYTVTTYTAAGSYGVSDVCTTSFSAPTDYKLMFQPTSVDVPCAADGSTAGAMDGDDLAYFPSADGTGTALIAANDGCSDTATGTAQTSYPVKATSGVALSVVLTEDGGTSQGAGYTLKYVAGRDDSIPCGTTAHALTGSTTAAYLTSPGFPAVITGSAADCVYTITADVTTKVVKVTPIVMNLLGTTGTCSSGTDQVQLFDGDSSSTDELATLCGTVWVPSPADYTSSQSKLTVKVKMTVDSNVFGFAVKYESVASGCTATTDAATATAFTVGEIGTTAITVSSTCSYAVTAPAGLKLIVQLVTVAAACGSAGSATTLKIYDGTATTGTTELVGDGCGTAASSTTATTGLNAYIQIVTGASSDDTGAGFTAKYIAGEESPGTCVAAGGTPTPLTATSTVAYLTSAGFPVALGGSDDCEYEITAAASAVVRMKILFINLPDAPCSADYLKLFSGTDTTVTAISVYCGTSWTQTSDDSETNVMTVVFKNTDSSVYGFAGSYEAFGGTTAMKSWGLLTIIAVSLGYLLSRYTN